MGGTDNSHQVHSSIESMDSQSMVYFSWLIFTQFSLFHSVPQKWIFRRHMSQPRMDASSVVASDSIMVWHKQLIHFIPIFCSYQIAGGQNDEVYNSTSFYRPDVDEWTNGITKFYYLNCINIGIILFSYSSVQGRRCCFHAMDMVYWFQICSDHTTRGIHPWSTVLRCLSTLQSLYLFIGLRKRKEKDRTLDIAF